MTDIFYAVFVLVMLNVWCALGVIAIWTMLDSRERKLVDECTRPLDTILWPMIILSLLLKRHEDTENVKKT